MAGESLTDRSFLERVLSHLPKRRGEAFEFVSWSSGDRVVPEGLGVLSLPPSMRPESLIARIMDIPHYVGPIPHVLESRVIPDARYSGPDAFRVYQRANVPMLKDVHHETVRCCDREVDGYQCVYWNLLEAETAALSNKEAARSQYHSGVWLTKPGVLVYGLASLPRREDLGFLMWQTLTKGVSSMAPRIFTSNMKAMVAWAERAP